MSNVLWIPPKSKEVAVKETYFFWLGKEAECLPFDQCSYRIEHRPVAWRGTMDVSNSRFTGVLHE